MDIVSPHFNVNVNLIHFFLSLHDLPILGIQEKLGLINNGIVYALYDYDAQNEDELSFKEGDIIKVLRKGDENEKEWWWSKIGNNEGYVPRNLIGVGVFFYISFSSN